MSSSYSKRQFVTVVSSIAGHLPEHNKAAIDSCLVLDFLPKMTEPLSSNDGDAVAALRKTVDSADIYIAIIGHKYGDVPAGFEKSIIEMEYDRAVERGLPRLVFLIGKEHPIKLQDVEKGEGVAKLEAFKTRLQEREITKSFNSLGDLRADLIFALLEVKKRLEEEARRYDELQPRRQREVLRVFVASPGDVLEERSRMPKITDRLNKNLASVRDVMTELWRWEIDAPPAVGEPQALINPELDAADIVLVIFWNRFGMQTRSGRTGTEEEVIRSLERWNQVRRPQVMMYFCKRPALLQREEAEQRIKVLDFRQRISSLALTAEYEEINDFEWRVHDDLFKTVLTLLKSSNKRAAS